MGSIWIGFLPHYHYVVPTAADVYLSCINQDNDKFIPSCTPMVIGNGCIYYPENQPYVKELTNSTYNQLRHIDFTTQLDILDEYLEFGRNIWLGTHNAANIHSLKQHFGDRCVSLTFTFDDALSHVIADDIKTTVLTKRFEDIDISDVDMIRTSIVTIDAAEVDIALDLRDVYDIRMLENQLYSMGVGFSNRRSEFRTRWYCDKLPSLPQWLKQ